MGRNTTVKGQIALIILTVMAVALTLGLSLSQRVITELEVSEEEEKSTQAFSAAEGGVEEALRILDQGGDVDTELDTSQIAVDLGVDNLDIQTTVVGARTQFTYPVSVDSGNAIIIWLRDHDENGNLDLTSGYNEVSVDVCWESGAAIEVVYFYDKGGNDYDISHFAFDSDPTRGNGFMNTTDAEVTEEECAGLDYSGEVDLSLGTPLFLVVRPFYQSTEIGAEGLGTAALPEQGHKVVSSAEVTRSGSEKISRRIKVFRGWEIPSEYFYHSVFANTGVTTQ